MRQILATLAAAVLAAAALSPAAAGSGETMSGSRGPDRQEILDHIHSIFRAYLDRDREAIRRLHTADWTGFQGPSTSIERGIDAYMVNADRSLEAFRGTGYELLETEVQLMGDFAVVYYVARYDFRDAEGHEKSLPLRAVDLYRREKGGWNQFGSHITVIPRGNDWGAK